MPPQVDTLLDKVVADHRESHERRNAAGALRGSCFDFFDLKGDAEKKKKGATKNSLLKRLDRAARRPDEPLHLVIGCTVYSADSLFNQLPKRPGFNVAKPILRELVVVDALFVDEASQMLSSTAALVLDLLDPVRRALGASVPPPLSNRPLRISPRRLCSRAQARSPPRAGAGLF